MTPVIGVSLLLSSFAEFLYKRFKETNHPKNENQNLNIPR